MAMGLATGCRTKTFIDYFPKETHDVNWLPHIGRWGWILLTKDRNIAENVTERNAIVNAGVRAFVIQDGRLSRADIIELLKFHIPRMMNAIAAWKAPFVFGLESASTELTVLSELAGY
jgi:hypothetical protein